MYVLVHYKSAQATAHGHDPLIPTLLPNCSPCYFSGAPRASCTENDTPPKMSPSLIFFCTPQYYSQKKKEKKILISAQNFFV